MADDPTNDTESKPAAAEQPPGSDDAETAAATEELKQTVISEPKVKDGTAESNREATPSKLDTDEAQSGPENSHLMSPKKKRPHDQVDGEKTPGGADEDEEGVTPTFKNEAVRSGPLKKRHRDEVDDSADGGAAPKNTSSTAENQAEPDKHAETEPVASSSTSDVPKPSSSSAFASSGFAKLATSASPFGALGAPSSISVFGSAKPPSLATSKPAAPQHTPSLSFQSAASTSPFATLAGSSSNGFGGTTSSFGAFGGSGAAPTLSSFGHPGGKLSAEKAAKPFGAPDSAEEDDSEDEDGEQDSGPDEERSIKGDADKEDEKKRLRLQRIEVDDGEAGEVTILQVRAKLFYLDKDSGWKERGGGMLKINVPDNCIQFDEAGIPVPGSFDASDLAQAGESDEAEEGGGYQGARLIMRQDQTHRVLLNTALLPAMDFREKASLKSVSILFTAFEGREAKAVNITVKMSAASSKSFLAEVASIKRELRGA